MTRTPIHITLLLPLLLLAALGLPGAAFAADDGRLQFNSYTPKTMYELAYKPRREWKKQRIWGTLSYPDNAKGKVPAVVLVHGSDGVQPHLQQWVEAFHEIGVATFVVDSYGPRGVGSTVADQRLVPYAANLVDVFQALKLLDRLQRIDSKKIGIMGFSRGGSVVYQSALEPFRRVLLPSRLQFAFQIAAYAGCNQVYWSPQLRKTPFLNLVGGADDYTTAEPCEKLGARYAAEGVPLQTIRYPEAPHAWDSLVGLRWLPEASSGAACGVLRWDIASWKIYADLPAEFVAPRELDAFFAACTTRGAHVGRHEESYRQSRADVQNFVRKVLTGRFVGGERELH